MNSKKVEIKKSGMNLYIILGAIILLIFSLVALVFLAKFMYSIFWSVPGELKRGDLAEFGDFLGGILNPAVALLALIALIVSIIFQKKGMDEARTQVDKARESEKNMLNQQHFFDWMGLYNDAINQFSGKKTFTTVLDGSISTFPDTDLKQLMKCSYIDKFPNAEHICHGIKYTISSNEFNPSPPMDDESKSGMRRQDHMIPSSPEIQLDLKSLKSCWGMIYDQSPSLASYFRVVHNFLEFMSEMNGDKGRSFAKIFRAQLTEDEILLIAFNILFHSDGEGMIPLVEKFSLLKHLPKKYYFLKHLIIEEISEGCLKPADKNQAEELPIQVKNMDPLQESCA